VEGQPPAPAHGEGSQRVRGVEEAEDSAMHQTDKLYREVMLLSAALASPKERKAMAETTDWRPLLPPYNKNNFKLVKHLKTSTHLAHGFRYIHGCQYPDMYLNILRFYDTIMVN
jgi:hypothetical protein